jgi:1-phosphatidylinositol-3-phosphate 5-kinase
MAVQEGDMLVGIIDYLRQYDYIKVMESNVKSVAMIAGGHAPTVIKPSHYKERFKQAMDRYFDRIPDAFTFS